VDSAYHRGLALFNAGRFYDAHEALEDAWRESGEPEKLFLQGLVQAAVALHHHASGNLEGACSVLARACRNLSPYPEIYAEINVGALRLALDAWGAALERGLPPPAPPLIDICGRSQC
jgi:predicted metal-dependent hydrolase